MQKICELYHKVKSNDIIIFHCYDYHTHAVIRCCLISFPTSLFTSVTSGLWTILKLCHWKVYICVYLTTPLNPWKFPLLSCIIVSKLVQIINTTSLCKVLVSAKFCSSSGYCSQYSTIFNLNSA